MRRAAVLLCLLMAGCSQTHAGGDDQTATPLDAAAIEAGVIADPQALDLAGSFADTGGTGSDAFCASGDREKGYNVGVLVTFGEGSQCEAQGRAALDGERARIDLTRDSDGDALAGCSFTARFDGSALALPGSLPGACAKACSARASLAGAGFALVEQGAAAAAATRGRAVKELCAG